MTVLDTTTPAKTTQDGRTEERVVLTVSVRRGAPRH